MPEIKSYKKQKSLRSPENFQRRSNFLTLLFIKTIVEGLSFFYCLLFLHVCSQSLQNCLIYPLYPEGRPALLTKYPARAPGKNNSMNHGTSCFSILQSKKTGFSERDKCEQVLLRLLLAGNLVSLWDRMEGAWLYAVRHEREISNAGW